MKRKFLTICAFALAVAAAAQLPSEQNEEKPTPDYGDFTIDAQVRAFGEVRGGWGTLNDNDAGSNLYVNDRVRLSFGWERKNISLKIAAQHTGLWQGASHKNTAGNISLHEAWAKMTFGKGFFAQAGRQELSYDDERLLGAHDWVATGRSHDALRLGWEGTKHRLHAIVGFNQTADVPVDFSLTPVSSSPKLYKNMQVLWYHFGAEQSPFQISALLMNQGASDIYVGGIRYMQTFGTYMSYEKRKFLANASLYYQTGKDRTGLGVRAFMMSGNFGWKFSPKWQATIGDDYLSGSDGKPGMNRTFNVLYGSYHKFLGSMDHFGYNTIPRYGINDLNAKVNYNCGPKFDMSFAVHWFATSRPVMDYLKDPLEHLLDMETFMKWRGYNGSHRFSRNLGSELDLQFNARPWKFVTIQAGYSLMIATETMQLLKGLDAKKCQNWAWVCLDINPTIFSTRHRR